MTRYLPRPRAFSKSDVWAVSRIPVAHPTPHELHVDGQSETWSGSIRWLYTRSCRMLSSCLSTIRGLLLWHDLVSQAPTQRPCGYPTSKSPLRVQQQQKKSVFNFALLEYGGIFLSTTNEPTSTRYDVDNRPDPIIDKLGVSSIISCHVAWGLRVPGTCRMLAWSCAMPGILYSGVYTCICVDFWDQISKLQNINNNNQQNRTWNRY